MQNKKFLVSGIAVVLLVLAGFGWHFHNAVAARKTPQQQQPISSGASSSNSGAAVIVKSDNIVTDADKQEVLNQLQNEVDSMVDSLNNMDDVSDSDLKF